MYLIDKTYFQGIISFPNASEYDGSTQDPLELAIDTYCPMFLQEVLGTVLFNELNPLISGVVLSPTAPQKWKNLVDGCTYEDGKKIWKGLRYTQGLYKGSILAYFTYYMQYQASYSSGVGQIVNTAKNATNVNPTQHLTDVWNGFVEMYQGTCYNEPVQIYRNGTLFVDYLGGGINNSGYVSLLEFLSDKETDYPEYTATALNYKNQLGL